MAVPFFALGEPLTQEKVRSLSYGKAFILLSFLVGVGCAVFLLRGEQDAAVEPSISMAAQPMKLGSVQPRMLPTQASKILASLPGNPALKQKVIRAIEANSGRCVSVKAEAGEQRWPFILSDEGASDQKPLTKEQVMEMPGITAPLGLFDPLGISTNVPEGRLLFFREAELRHGRVCMLAILGLIVGDRHDFFPILGGGIDNAAPAYLFGTPFIQETSAAAFWPVAFAAIFLEEARGTYGKKIDVLGGTQASTPGDYGWDPLGLKPTDPQEFKTLQTKELNNGRLAMFAAAGWIAQEQATGQKLWPFLQ